MYILYLSMFSAFGLALVLDEFNRPGVIHGSLFMNFVFALALRNGKD